MISNHESVIFIIDICFAITTMVSLHLNLVWQILKIPSFIRNGISLQCNWHEILQFSSLLLKRTKYKQQRVLKSMNRSLKKLNLKPDENNSNLASVQTMRWQIVNKVLNFKKIDWFLINQDNLSLFALAFIKILWKFIVFLEEIALDQ